MREGVISCGVAVTWPIFVGSCAQNSVAMPSELLLASLLTHVNRLYFISRAFLRHVGTNLCPPVIDITGLARAPAAEDRVKGWSLPSHARCRRQVSFLLPCVCRGFNTFQNEFSLLLPVFRASWPLLAWRLDCAADRPRARCSRPIRTEYPLGKFLLASRKRCAPRNERQNVGPTPQLR